MPENYTLHRQWATRPHDERYPDLDSMFDYLKREAEQSRTIDADTDMLRVVPVGANGEQNDLGIVGKSGNPAIFTHWSMTQASAAAGAPSQYMRQLPATLAADCLNYGLTHAPRQSQQLYIRQVPANGTPAHLELRSLTSTGYSRILSAHIVNKLMAVQQQNPSWQAPMVYDRGDFGGEKTPCVGFAGDRDAYICLQNINATITDPTSKEPLMRFLMLVNSEVGAKRLDLVVGLCRYICGNFIIWGVSNQVTFRMRHYGEKIRREWQRGIGQAFTDYSEQSAREETARLQAASIKQLGPSKTDVIDVLFKKAIATKEQLTDAYELAERYENDPRSAWGFSNGLSRLSQLSPYQDERVDLDRAAGKILDF